MGGVIALGKTACQGSGSFDISLIRMDKKANIQWAKILGESNTDDAIKLVSINDSVFVVAGNIDIAGNDNMFVACLNGSGDTLWTNQYDFGSTEYLHDIIQASDNGFAFIGSRRKKNSLEYDYLLVKTDIKGNVLWSKSFDGSANDDAYAICEMKNKGFVIAGNTLSNGIVQEVLVIKTDSIGNILYSKTIGDTNTNYVTDVQSTPDGGVVLCGRNRVLSSTLFGFENNDNSFLIKLDKKGNIKWSKQYGEEFSNERPYNVEVLANGYLLSGETESYSSIGYDLFMIKTDTSGNVVWANNYGEDGVFEYGGYVSLSKDGGLLLCGQKQKEFGGSDYDSFIIKTGKNGETKCISTNINPSVTSYTFTQKKCNLMSNSLPALLTHGIVVSDYTFYKDSIFCEVNEGENSEIEISGISNTISAEKVNVYPNPMQDVLKIESLTNLQKVEIFDFSGKKVISIYGDQILENEINVSYLSHGLYLVNISTSENLIQIPVCKNK